MKEYLTEEELKLLVEELEQQELYAPRHMKEQILSQAFPKQTVTVLPQSGGGRKRQRGASAIGLLSYRLKIIAGMAAALLMLALLPMQEDPGQYMVQEERPWQEDLRGGDGREDRTDLNGMLNGSMRRTSERLNAWIGRIDHLQLGSLFGMENGGTDHEN